MTENPETLDRPKWVRELHLFITDTILDEQFEYPMDGADDELHDAIESALNVVLCEHFGHDVIDDMCGKPEHRYCVWCRKGTIDLPIPENTATPG